MSKFREFLKKNSNERRLLSGEQAGKHSRKSRKHKKQREVQKVELGSRLGQLHVAEPGFDLVKQLLCQFFVKK